jgi:hypothetical protein
MGHVGYKKNSSFLVDLKNIGISGIYVFLGKFFSMVKGIVSRDRGRGKALEW